MNPLRLALTLILLIGLAGTGRGDESQLSLPSIGDSSGQIISPEEERQLGEAIFRRLRQHQQVVSDPELQAYIHSLGYQLAANSDAPGQHFTFFLLDDPSINASAWIGGFIGVHTGLILETESESELAGVIAHEIAHVTQRHVQRFHEAADKLTLPQLAAVAAAILLGSQSPELGQAAISSVIAGSAQYQIDFTRAKEYEADRLGIQTLARAGFDPFGMPRFFQQLQQATRHGQRPPEFLSTHPLTEGRIAESLSRAEQYPRPQAPDSLAFHLAREKIRVLSSTDPQTLVNYYERSLDAGRYQSEDAQRYGYALALAAAGNYPAAQAELDKLLSGDPDRIAYIIATAQTELAAGDTKTALDRYADALRLYPHNYPLTITYADALLRSGRAASARELLQEHLRYRQPSAELYKLLAQASADAGHPGEGHGYMAEYYYLNGQTHAAIDQLKLALRDPALDDYQARRLESRLKQLKEEAIEETGRQEKDAPPN